MTIEKIARGTTITNFLASGNPEGIIFSYMSNWTGQAIKIPRNLFNEARAFPELDKPGIYFLIGQDQENPEDKLIYTGEANNLKERLITHLRSIDKNFCEVIICFSSKDENLTVSHTKYLEEKIIKRLLHSNEYRMVNGTAGNSVNLPRMVRDEMDTYFDNMKVVLPTLGYNLLHIEKARTNKDEVKTAELFLEVSGFKAFGKLTSNGLLVFKGSGMNPKETPSYSGTYSNIRKTLREKEIVKETGGKLEFDQDYEFTSSSMAGAIILGYSVNGRTVWKNKDSKSIKELEEEQLKAIDANEIAHNNKII